MYYFTGDCIKSTEDDSFELWGSSTFLRGSKEFASLGYVFGLDDSIAIPVKKSDLKFLDRLDLPSLEYKVIYEDARDQHNISKLKDFARNRNNWQISSVDFEAELLTSMLIRKQACEPNLFYHIGDTLYILRDFMISGEVAILTYETYKIKNVEKFKLFLTKSALLS